MVQQIYLASKSPRRRELLDQIGVGFEVVSADIDETAYEHESAEEFVLRMAKEKARAGYESVNLDKRLPTLGADTVVVVDGVVFGKPIDQQDSFKMLSKLSGRSHEVYTSVAIAFNGSVISSTNKTLVAFRSLDEAEILAYIETKEPADKAGSYAIQGVAARFITQIDGSYSGVMGLPIFETAELLKEIEGKI